MHTNVDQINIKMDRVIDLLSHMAHGGSSRKPMSPTAMVEIKKASELMPDQSVVHLWVPVERTYLAREGRR